MDPDSADSTLDERRVHPRIIIEAPVSMQTGSGTTLHGTAEDISTGGARVRCRDDESLRQVQVGDQGTPLALRITLPDLYGGHELSGSGRLVWKRSTGDEAQCGVFFTHMDDDSARILLEMAEAATADAREALEMLTRAPRRT